MTTKTLSQHKTETVAAAREQGYAGTDAEYEMTADDTAFIARAMVGDVESVVGHDGSGDLRVIVEQAIRDGVETVEEMADIVREARADAAVDDEGQTDDRMSEDADDAARESEANEQIADENDAALDAEATASFAAHTRATNAVWSSTSARSEIKVWADGGCIWAQRPADPTVAEQATYEATDHDDNGLECAWQVIVNGKVDGSLRFEAR